MTGKPAKLATRRWRHRRSSSIGTGGGDGRHEKEGRRAARHAKLVIDKLVISRRFD